MLAADIETQPEDRSFNNYRQANAQERKSMSDFKCYQEGNAKSQHTLRTPAINCTRLYIRGHHMQGKDNGLTKIKNGL